VALLAILTEVLFGIINKAVSPKMGLSRPLDTELTATYPRPTTTSASA
jgi:hypothetical protein